MGVYLSLFPRVGRGRWTPKSNPNYAEQSYTYEGQTAPKILAASMRGSVLY
jgi:hypothetical protein